MPFGLSNAPGTFQQMMDGILRGDIDKDAVFYLDDVVPFGNTLEQTLSSCGKHLGKLSAAGLKCSQENGKCSRTNWNFLDMC